jgi:lipoyl(octanoyl) transferase
MILIENKKINKIFGQKFEFVDSGYCDGKFNMDFDYQRMLDCTDNICYPIFRLYGWDPWTVSLGANQKESDILEENCREYGLGIVRRPTGGRAVLHANELTYSVVTPLPDSMSVHDAYREIHLILLNAIQRIIPSEIEFQKSQPDLRNFYKTSAMSVSCFASSARYEIEWQGRKIVGSAQRLYNNILLQHGSILLGEGHEILSKVVKANCEEDRIKLEHYILQHSATLSEVAGREIQYKDCADAIIEVLNE